MKKRSLLLIIAALLEFNHLPTQKESIIPHEIGIFSQVENYSFSRTPVFLSQQYSNKPLDEVMCDYFNISQKELRKMKTGRISWPENNGGLVRLPKEYLFKSKEDAVNESKLLEPVALAFKEMVDSANKEGINLFLGSGYRNKIEQAGIYKNANGSRKVAPPGGSKHHLGIALDITNKTDFINSKKRSKPYRWLKQNAEKFGFRLTIFNPFEPWHWEYDSVKLKEEYIKKMRSVYSEKINSQSRYSLYNPPYDVLVKN